MLKHNLEEMLKVRDSKQIRSLPYTLHFQSVKLTSISDIIHFIMNNIERCIDLSAIQQTKDTMLQLQSRLTKVQAGHNHNHSARQKANDNGFSKCHGRNQMIPQYEGSSDSEHSNQSYEQDYDLHSHLLKQSEKISQKNKALTVKISELESVVHRMLLRLEEVERPKGLDHVMLEETKAIVEAIIESREQRRGVEQKAVKDKNVSEPLECSDRILLQQILNGRLGRTRKQAEGLNSAEYRNSLGEIDLNRMFQNYGSRQLHDPMSCTTDQICSSNSGGINQISGKLLTKPDRKELTELKLNLVRQITNKVSLEQVEQVVQKVRMEILEKVNHFHQSAQANFSQLRLIVQDDLTKTHENVCRLRRELLDRDDISEHHKIIDKINKRVEECRIVTEDNIKSVRRLEGSQEVAKRQLVEMSNRKYEEIQKDCTCILKEIEAFLSGSIRNKASVAVFESVSLHQRSKQALWTRQKFNTCPDSYMFQENKAKILLVETGTYRVQVFTNGHNKDFAPAYIAVSELEGHRQESVLHITSPSYASSLAIVRKTRSELSLRFETVPQYDWLLLRVQKLF